MIYVKTIIWVLFVCGMPSVIYYLICKGLNFIQNKWYTEKYKEMYKEEFKEFYNKCIEENIGDIILERLNNNECVATFKFNKNKIFWLFGHEYAKEIVKAVIYELIKQGYNFNKLLLYDLEVEVILQSVGEQNG